MARRVIALCALLGLGACGAERVWAPDEVVEHALWRADGPPSITLVTVVSTRAGSAGHSALLVNGSHRALYDPAGTFRLPFVPERNDVLYGMTDRAWAVYVDYHARETYDVRLQEVAVTPAQAEAALRAMQAEGPAGKATCNRAVTRVLSQVPGFERVPRGWFPNRTAAWLATRPGVTETVITDDDADANHGVLFEAAPPQSIESDR
jgi:hypothetical protein